jgi:hypothetical protein
LIRTDKKYALLVLCTAIILAFGFTVIVGSVAAYSNGGQYNIINNDGAVIVQPVLIGQDLSFAEGWGAKLVTIFRVNDGLVNWPKIDWAITADLENKIRISGDEWLKDGAFYVNYDMTTGSADAQLSFSEPNMPLEIKVDTKKVSSIAMGTNITIDTIGMNLFEEDVVDLIVNSPDGQIKTDLKNFQQFAGITVRDLKANYGNNNLKTKGWTLGNYTFQIMTKPGYACSLEAESLVRNLTIRSDKINITTDTLSCHELQTVKLIVMGVAGDVIKVESVPLSPHVLFLAGIDDTPVDATNQFTDTIDADGIRTYRVKFTEAGTYSIRVTVIGGERAGDFDRVGVTASRP